MREVNATHLSNHLTCRVVGGTHVYDTLRSHASHSHSSQEAGISSPLNSTRPGALKLREKCVCREIFTCARPNPNGCDGVTFHSAHAARWPIRSHHNRLGASGKGDGSVTRRLWRLALRRVRARTVRADCVGGGGDGRAVQIPKMTCASRRVGAQRNDRRLRLLRAMKPPVARVRRASRPASLRLTLYRRTVFTFYSSPLLEFQAYVQA